MCPFSCLRPGKMAMPHDTPVSHVAEELSRNGSKCLSGRDYWVNLISVLESKEGLLWTPAVSQRLGEAIPSGFSEGLE